MPEKSESARNQKKIKTYLKVESVKIDIIPVDICLLNVTDFTRVGMLLIRITSMA